MLKRTKSQPIFERAMSVIAKGVNSNFRYWGPKSTPVISHAKGAYITDADHNTFIDYRLGWGPIILGHADDRINEAVSASIKNGTTFAATTKLETEVAEKMVEMIYNTWLIQTSIELTNNLLDSGEKPGVISAIMKQQTTDRAREVLNEGMDIHAGSAICLGENNFLEKFYKSAPIGITVEGSNTLTRSLMIFGQGLNKSHPHIYPILDSILNDNIDNFRENFKKIIKHSVKLYFKAMTDYECKDTLEKQTMHFANLANFIALKGGKLKAEQSISGDMADILSNLYLGHCVRWYEEENNISKELTEYCIERLCRENQEKMNKIIENEGYLKYLLFFCCSTIRLYMHTPSLSLFLCNNIFFLLSLFLLVVFLLSLTLFPLILFSLTLFSLATTAGSVHHHHC